jgi:hypothetical protein
VSLIFRVISIILIAAVIVFVFIKLKPYKVFPKDVWRLLKKDFRENLIIAYRIKTASKIQKVKSIVAHLCAGLFIILFITGFLPVFFGYHMSGLFIMIHVQAALLLSVCLVVFVFLFSNNNQLSIQELKKIVSEYQQKNKLNPIIMLKVFYWLILALIQPAMFSIILMLYPIFGTDGLEFLADVHRYSVLLLTISVIFVQYFRIVFNCDDHTKGV